MLKVVEASCVWILTQPSRIDTSGEKRVLYTFPLNVANLVCWKEDVCDCSCFQSLFVVVVHLIRKRRMPKLVKSVDLTLDSAVRCALSDLLMDKPMPPLAG